MSKKETLNKKNQHNCPEVVCEQRKDGTRTVGGGEVQGAGAGKASSLLVPHVREGEG